MTELICKRLLLLTVLFGLVGCVTTRIGSISSERMQEFSALLELPWCSWGQDTGCIEQVKNQVGPIRYGVFHGAVITTDSAGVPLDAWLYVGGKPLRKIDIPELERLESSQTANAKGKGDGRLAVEAAEDNAKSKELAAQQAETARLKAEQKASEKAELLKQEERARQLAEAEAKRQALWHNNKQKPFKL